MPSLSKTPTAGHRRRFKIVTYRKFPSPYAVLLLLFFDCCSLRAPPLPQDSRPSLAALRPPRRKERYQTKSCRQRYYSLPAKCEAPFFVWGGCTFENVDIMISKCYRTVSGGNFVGPANPPHRRRFHYVVYNEFLVS